MYHMVTTVSRLWRYVLLHWGKFPAMFLDERPDLIEEFFVVRTRIFVLTDAPNLYLAVNGVPNSLET